ncbi:hypothetical protein [Bacillus toyonensis]|uniref:hypothetical protein n=1 Tax=Bacillus toyonensis TaxID=155322 RepID=UPI0021D14ECF|nr:hypothetical protein [Bacillus toyonensis]MCU5181540.1 hypothetical protein [Bacillus toyonensis]
MKYTRNRQMGKSMKWKAWKGQKNLEMSEMTKRTKELDPTFKWHRGYNNVSIQDGDKILFIDLYEVDFCYY